MCFIYIKFREKIINIAKSLKIDAKTVVNIKKRLEKKEVIIKYSTLFNYPRLNIQRTYLFVQPSYEQQDEDKRLVSFTRDHKNFVKLIKIIGNYEILLVIEHFGNLTDIIKDLRKNVRIQDYWIIDSANVLKQSYIPTDL